MDKERAPYASNVLLGVKELEQLVSFKRMPAFNLLSKLVLCRKYSRKPCYVLSDTLPPLVARLLMKSSGFELVSYQHFNPCPQNCTFSTRNHVFQLKCSSINATLPTDSLLLSPAGSSPHAISRLRQILATMKIVSVFFLHTANTLLLPEGALPSDNRSLCSLFQARHWLATAHLRKTALLCPKRILNATVCSLTFSSLHSTSFAPIYSLL